MDVALQTPTSLCGLSPSILSCPQDSQSHCTLCLTSALPGPAPLGGTQEGKSCGSETALTRVSSAGITPGYSPSTAPRRTTGETTGPRFPPGTKIWGGFLFIWQKSRGWRSRGCVRVLTTELGRRMVEQEPGASEHCWVLHCLAGASTSQSALPGKQVGEVGAG